MTAATDRAAKILADAVLRDGTTVTVRPMRPDDGERLLEFHSRLSARSQRLRFFSAHPRLSEREVDRFTHVDGHDRTALVAEHDGQIIAVARYDRITGTRDAEAAFVVRDDHHGRGLATLLLARLAAAARAEGLDRLVAQTLPENTHMLHVFARHAPAVTCRFRDGVVDVTIPLDMPAQPAPAT